MRSYALTVKAGTLPHIMISMFTRSYVSTKNYFTLLDTTVSTLTRSNTLIVNACTLLDPMISTLTRSNASIIHGSSQDAAMNFGQVGSANFCDLKSCKHKQLGETQFSIDRIDT